MTKQVGNDKKLLLYQLEINDKEEVEEGGKRTIERTTRRDGRNRYIQ